MAMPPSTVFPTVDFDSVDDWDGTSCQYNVHPAPTTEQTVQFPMGVTVPYRRKKKFYRVRAGSDCKLFWLNGPPPGLTFTFVRTIIPL